jgi:hypothetical protein
MHREHTDSATMALQASRNVKVSQYKTVLTSFNFTSNIPAAAVLLALLQLVQSVYVSLQRSPAGMTLFHTPLARYHTVGLL